MELFRYLKLFPWVILRLALRISFYFWSLSICSFIFAIDLIIWFPSFLSRYLIKLSFLWSWDFSFMISSWWLKEILDITKDVEAYFLGEYSMLLIVFKQGYFCLGDCKIRVGEDKSVYFVKGLGFSSWIRDNWGVYL